MKKINMLEIKSKVICAGLGLAAESELNMLRRLEELMIDGIAMGYDFLASRCESAEEIIATLTMDHNSTPNYVQGFDAAQRHFGEFPNSPIRTGKASELIGDSTIFPIARVVVAGDKITEAAMCAPGLPDGEHLLYPVLIVKKTDSGEDIKELMKVLQGMDEAYCRAGTPLDKAERHEDRLRLIACRAAIAKHGGKS